MENNLLLQIRFELNGKEYGAQMEVDHKKSMGDIEHYLERLYRSAIRTIAKKLNKNRDFDWGDPWIFKGTGYERFKKATRLSDLDRDKSKSERLKTVLYAQGDYPDDHWLYNRLDELRYKWC